MNEAIFYRSFIEDELERRCEKNPRYSLRAFARALGFEATVISQIISGKRIPSLRTAEKLVGALGMSPIEEQHFLASLAEVHRSRGLERLSPFFKKFKSQPSRQDLSLDLFRVIADWHHYAILALSLTEGFKSDPKWIAMELDLSPMQTKLAIHRLLKLGLLASERGKLRASSEGFTTADKQITNAALKKRQKQVLEKAIHSLENDPIEIRSNSSMTMAIDSEKLPLAKHMIEEFTQKLSSTLESGNKTQVYELGIALFPLQRRSK